MLIFDGQYANHKRFLAHNKIHTYECEYEQLTQTIDQVIYENNSASSRFESWTHRLNDLQSYLDPGV